MRYTEKSKCPICADISLVAIEAHGDYDGPNKPRVTNPDLCKKCAGIKACMPDIYKMMRAVHDDAQNKLKEIEKREDALYDNYITRFDIESRLHQLDRDFNFWKVFNKERKERNKISKEVHEVENTEWVLEGAVKKAMWYFYKSLQKKKSFLDEKSSNS